MKRVYFVGLLGAVVSTCLGLASCSEDTTTQPPAGVKDTGVAGDSNTGDTNVSPDAPKSDTKTEGGGDGCPSTIKQEGTVTDLRKPDSAKKAIPNDGVKINGAIVTSIKWRTRNPSASFKSCLYSIFVADPNATYTPYSGVQIIAYGDDPTEGDGGFRCDDTTDPIPKDIKIGDIVDITGVYTEFGPTSATCGAATPATPPPNPDKQAQVRACAVVKKGTGTPVAPATVTLAQISDGSAELAGYAGGLVKVVNVEASAAASFGNFPLKDSKVAVSDIIWYRGTGWTVANGAKFDEIVGNPLIDFCTWSIAPSFCNDAKASTGTNIMCPASMGSDAGTDAPADGG